MDIPVDCLAVVVRPRRPLTPLHGRPCPRRGRVAAREGRLLPRLRSGPLPLVPPGLLHLRVSRLQLTLQLLHLPRERVDLLLLRLLGRRGLGCRLPLLARAAPLPQWQLRAIHVDRAGPRCRCSRR